LPPLGAAFRKGLNEAGYFEGQNVTVEYHWLEGASAAPALTNPTTGIAGCCARAASGQAAAPPRSALAR
jgi:hypothetical protein